MADIYVTLGTLPGNGAVHKCYGGRPGDYKPLCCAGGRQHLRLEFLVGTANEGQPGDVFSKLATAGVSVSRLCRKCFGRQRMAYRVYLDARGNDRPGK